MYGGFTSNVDMKSGAPAFGTPEYTRAALVGGQLCRRYGVPYRSSNANASNAVDAQAAYESEMSVWGAVMGHANLVMHIAEGGPGGHFFGVGHTLERYETAFYSPLLSDWRNFENWQLAGGETATQRAGRIVKQVLADYQPPPLDPALAEELDAFVARRKVEGGAPSNCGRRPAGAIPPPHASLTGPRHAIVMRPPAVYLCPHIESGRRPTPTCFPSKVALPDGRMWPNRQPNGSSHGVCPAR